jgi:Zn ribbon nucleic-acid-binding protein
MSTEVSIPGETSRCKYCGEDRPRSAFTVCRVIGEKVYRRLKCLPCTEARNNERRAELRHWLDDYKKTLSCTQCGFADHRALAFHHEDAEEKEFNVADMVRSIFSRDAILREIAKCVALCSNCHQITHYEQRYAPEGASSVPALPLDRPAGGGRLCRYCGVEQDESRFEVCKVVGDRVYRRHRCRDCKQAGQNRRRGNLRLWVEDLKKGRRCSQCGFADHRAFELHHRDGQEKDLAIGEMVKDGRSRAAILREMAGCVLLCANCHRITHFGEREQLPEPLPCPLFSE